MKLRNSWLSAAGTLLVLVIGGAVATPARAQNPVWTIASASSPTNFAPGDETGDDKYVLTVVDTGGGSNPGSPIEVSDTLPSGVTASAISGEDLGNGKPLSCSLAPKPACSYEGFEMASGDELRIEVTVEVSSEIAASVINSVSVTGGGAATGAQAEDPTAISSTQAGFGITDFATTWSEEQAGASVNLTAQFTFNQIASGGETIPAENPKDVTLDLPPGFIPNPKAAAMCPLSQAIKDSCPAESAVGVVFTSGATGTGGAPTPYSSLLYDTEPAPGQFGRLTFLLGTAPVILDLNIRPDGTYGVSLTAENLTQVEPLISMTMTLWGVPAAYNGAGPDHVLAGAEPSYGGPSSDLAGRFLTSPTTCAPSPDSTLSTDSWSAAGIFGEAASATPKQTGCNRLPFNPSLDVFADSRAAEEPSGYEMDLHFAQSDTAGLADSAPEKAAIALPQGAAVSISAANGMASCSEAQAAWRSLGPAACPEASKVGLLEVQTPLLSEPLQGAIYFARAYENPLNSPLAMYFFAENPESGVLIKLAGRLQADPLTGQVTIVFDELPQLPIEILALRFFGGARALLSTPPTCGTATSEAELTPWSADASVIASSSFQIESGANGTSCSAPHPFSPAFLSEAKATDEADTFDSLAFFVSRPEYDTEQELETIAIEAPSALTQTFAGVAPCEEPEATQGACPAGSEVGTITATAGLSADPVALAGAIYLTGPYGGSAQGLTVVLPISPGPFELGTAVVRMSVKVNPSTGELILTSGQVPSIVDGVPLHLNELMLLFDRGVFKVNPTCESLAITGTITGTEGGAARITANPGTSSPACPQPEEPHSEEAPRVRLGAPLIRTATVTLVSRHFAVSALGSTTVKLLCKGSAACHGKMVLTGTIKGAAGRGRSKTVILGEADFSIKVDTIATVELELNARGRSMLRHDYGRLRALLTISKASPLPTQTRSENVRLAVTKTGRHTKQ